MLWLAPLDGLKCADDGVSACLERFLVTHTHVPYEYPLPQNDPASVNVDTVRGTVCTYGPTRNRSPVTKPE